MNRRAPFRSQRAIKRWLSLVALTLAASTASGCASGLGFLAGKRSLNERLDDRLSGEMREKVVIPFEITPELEDIARNIRVLRVIDYERAIALAEYLVSDKGFGIEYTWEGNKTAQEVYESRTGNCMGMSNLYIGMARAAGLKAVYVDVLSVERIHEEGDVIVKSGHITAGVINGGQLTLVDFAPNPERHYQRYRVIDDLEAIANYYNNAGYLTRIDSESRFASEAERAKTEIADYRMAIAVDPGFVRAYNNLGVSLKQIGEQDEAVDTFKKAISLDPSFAEAWANMASVYDDRGDVKKAIGTLEQAANFAGNNPFIFHHLGMLYYRQGDYRNASRNYHRALSRDPTLVPTRYMLALVYERTGKPKKAIDELEKLLEQQPDNGAARAKLDQLEAHEKGSVGDHDR